MARPSIYTKELCDMICLEIGQGGNLHTISKTEGFPSRDTLYKWLRDNEEFADNYARARQLRADARSDRLDDIRKDVLEGRIAPDIARVAVDIEKWQAGKENPKKYGDSINQKHTDGDGKPLVISDVTAKMLALLTDEQLEKLNQAGVTDGE